MLCVGFTISARRHQSKKRQIGQLLWVVFFNCHPTEICAPPFPAAREEERGGGMRGRLFKNGQCGGHRANRVLGDRRDAQEMVYGGDDEENTDPRNS